MIIVTHPDNEVLLHQALSAKHMVDHGALSILWLKIRTNPLMERDKPTGRYILNGRVVFACDVEFHTRFCVYGPRDIPYLLFAGIIQEEREPLFYEVNESLRVFHDFGVSLPTYRGVLLSHVTS